MGWLTAEDRVAKWIRLLVPVSGVACAIVSLLYLLVATMPIYHFHGYVRGYYSILDYRLYYSYNQQPIAMPITDYIRHVSVTFTLLSLALLALSILSIAFTWKRPSMALGLAYGVSVSLVALYGLLNGYIYRAVSADVGMFSYLARDVVVFRTLAGTITFKGVVIEPTSVHWIVLDSWVPPLLLALATASSATATGATLSKVYKLKPAERGEWWAAKMQHGAVYVTLVLITFSALASVFIYYPTTIGLKPQPPPATLEQPPYTYTCTALTRTSRGALAYTDFEAYPVPGWASSGGAWSSISGVPGAKGNVLQGQDNNGGVGAASHYYYNTRLDAYTSLWIAVKTKRVSGTGWYGISMMNVARNRMYTVELYTSGYLEVWSFNVISASWNRHASVSVPGYSWGSWYTIVVNYTVVGTTISITAYLYDASGSYVTAVSATITHSNVFTPAYLGVEVDNVVAYFDEFAVSTVDPRFLYFTGFYAGMGVEVWDNLGYLVNSATAPSSSFALGVVSDVVVGTGSNGRIVVEYPDNYLCGVLTVPATDAILGGDTYALSTSPFTLSLGANRTSASLTLYISGASSFNTTIRILRVNASQLLYARLILDAYTSPPTLNLDAWIEGTSDSTSISMRSGVPVTTSTSIVQLSLGLGNSIVLSGYFTATSQTAMLNLKLELCTGLGGSGACVYYPLSTELKS
ncbi:MAG: hypothetical protein QXJ26_01625 [Desulfurococcaceae archaeon]